MSWLKDKSGQAMVICDIVRNTNRCTHRSISAGGAKRGTTCVRKKSARVYPA